MLPLEKPERKLRFAIIFGANKFPLYPGMVEKISFEASATAFKDYLLDVRGLNLPPSNLLWLFNDSEPNSNQIIKMTEFVLAANKSKENQQTALGNGTEVQSELIVYYVGHGAYWGTNDFFLTPTNVRLQLESATSIRFPDLAAAIRKFTGRKYIILDCCFAAAAVKDLQGDHEGKEFGNYTQQYFPVSGTALLAASSKESPAEAPDDLEYTMFSQALIGCLMGRIEPPTNLVYTMEELHGAIVKVIQSNHALDGVRPEIHAPSQERGDITKVPLFPVVRAGASTPGELVRDVANITSQLKLIGDITPQTAERTLRYIWKTRQYGRLVSRVFWPLISLLAITAAIVASVYTYRAYHRVSPLIALQTDFGSKAPYMANLIGVIQSINPQAKVTTITSEIADFDRIDAAWTLWRSSRVYPEGTIFIVITDPEGIATDPVVIRTQQPSHIFIGHNNGCFDYVVEKYGLAEMYRIASPDLTPPHFEDLYGGVDLFGSTASKLSLGYPLIQVGPKIETYKKQLPPLAATIQGSQVIGSIVNIDKFGNANTNISKKDLEKLGIDFKKVLQVAIQDQQNPPTDLRMPLEINYGQVADDAPVAVIDSGYLQLALGLGNFRDKYKIKTASRVVVSVAP